MTREVCDDLLQCQICSSGVSVDASNSKISIEEAQSNRNIGVRDLVSRGYSIPGGASQGGVVRLWRSVSHVVRPGLRAVTRDVSARRVLTTVK